MPIKDKEHQRKYSHDYYIRSIQKVNRKYRIPQPDYEYYLSLPCGICGSPAAVLDHDHNHCKRGCSECIRGGLCRGCNTGLGFFEGWYAKHGEAAHAWISGTTTPSKHGKEN